MKGFLYALSFFTLLAVAWHTAVEAGLWSPVLLPAPESVAKYLWSSIVDGTLAQATLVTIRRLLVGYSIGLLIGLPLWACLQPASKFAKTRSALWLWACRPWQAFAGCR
jgi:NitT/TauT family transport system permease protein